MENYIKVIIITMIILMLMASSLFIYPPSTIACNLYSFLSIPFRPEQVKVIRNLLNSFQFIKKNSISCSSTFSGHIAVETKRQALPPRGIQGCRYQRFLSSSSGCRLQYPQGAVIRRPTLLQLLEQRNREGSFPFSTAAMEGKIM